MGTKPVDRTFPAPTHVYRSIDSRPVGYHVHDMRCHVGQPFRNFDPLDGRNISSHHGTANHGKRYVGLELAYANGHSEFQRAGIQRYTRQFNRKGQTSIQEPLQYMKNGAAANSRYPTEKQSTKVTKTRAGPVTIPDIHYAHALPRDAPPQLAMTHPHALAPTSRTCYKAHSYQWSTSNRTYGLHHRADSLIN
ncbi:hypothetical protein CYMTET_49240 [Cymbomonas tetramitiformis]|uniref:Uncharacterized protein n=1 Tax=Cymbomonas tetramitiformis TaxID=36881 RepID=A0AAE0EVZ2_9CHLO|nr:hypothetical protein CYMTET_49240 [Cymbomonas tetramitiformis]